jgi:nucleotide-binding universal stress UspA family protein
MYRNVLVPLDGSALAATAIPYARAVCDPKTGQLLLVRAANGDVVDEAERSLNETRQRLVDEGVRVETHVRYGSPADVITDEAMKLRADLVVMATHGRTGPARVVRGSVAEEVLLRSSVPVLLIPPHNRQPWPADGRSLLIPLDGSQLAEAALAPATELAQTLGLPLELIRIVEPVDESYLSDVNSDYLPAGVRSALDQARLYRERVAATIRGIHVRVAVEAGIGTPHETLADVATDEHVAGVVLATHGRTGLARTALGSVAGSLIHQATMPVMVVGPAMFSQTAESGLTTTGRREPELAGVAQ